MHGTRCYSCTLVHQRRQQADRGTSAQRGYGARWQRLRKMFLNAHPLCIHCSAEGRTEAATDVDHITARRDGGTDDWANLQPLCRSHHSRKTVTQNHGFGR